MGSTSNLPKPVQVAKRMHDRKLRRGLMQYFEPENYFEVCAALTQAKWQDLNGDECDRLIPARPSREALAARRQDSNAS